MRNVYLVLAVIGFGIPLAHLPETLDHGNLLLMGDPIATVELLFSNYASSAFAADLLWVFLVFVVWVVVESRVGGFRYPWLFVGLAFLFGVSGPLPLYLYYRERISAAA